MTPKLLGLSPHLHSNSLHSGLEFLRVDDVISTALLLSSTDAVSRRLDVHGLTGRSSTNSYSCCSALLHKSVLKKQFRRMAKAVKFTGSRRSTRSSEGSYWRGSRCSSGDYFRSSRSIRRQRKRMLLLVLLSKIGLQQKSSGVVKCRKIRIKIRDKKETVGADSTGSVVDDQEFESKQFNLRFHREWGNQSSVPPLPEQVHISSQTVLLGIWVRPLIQTRH